MMELTEIKEIAARNPLEINWDAVEKMPEHVLQRRYKMQVEGTAVLEKLYERLKVGDVIADISYEELEHYGEEAAIDLIQSYCILEMVERILTIQDILKA